MVKIISIGNSCQDIILRYVDRLPEWGTEEFFEESESRIAGQGVNFAIAAAKLSHKTFLVSNVGNDSVGRNFSSELDKVVSLDTRFLGRRPILPASR
jgi:sugar/nucleoside kinase (ribokinase family)